MADAVNRLPFVNAVSEGRFPGSLAVKRPIVPVSGAVKWPFPAFPAIAGSVSAKATAHCRGKRRGNGEMAVSGLSALSANAPFNRADKGRLNRPVSLSGNRPFAISVNRPETAETAVGTALNRGGAFGRFCGSRAVITKRETAVSGKRQAVPQTAPFGLTRLTVDLSGKRGDGFALVAANAQKHPLAVAGGIGGAA